MHWMHVNVTVYERLQVGSCGHEPCSGNMGKRATSVAAPANQSTRRRLARKSSAEAAENTYFDRFRPTPNGMHLSSSAASGPATHTTHTGTAPPGTTLAPTSDPSGNPASDVRAALTPQTLSAAVPQQSTLPVAAAASDPGSAQGGSVPSLAPLPRGWQPQQTTAKVKVNSLDDVMSWADDVLNIVDNSLPAGAAAYLIQAFQRATYSTSFSGIDAPGSAMCVAAATMSGRTGTPIRKPDHAHAVEWFPSSQKELLLHPSPPRLAAVVIVR